MGKHTPDTWRMDAYYYAFDRTKIDCIDKILSAVACAGKCYHHTENWTEDCTDYPHLKGGNCAAWIENAAKEAAEKIQALESQNERLRGELENIVNAKRFDPEHFCDDSQFVDWAISRARAALKAK